MVRLSCLIGVVLLGLALAAGTGTTGESKKGEIRGMLPAGWKALQLTEAQKTKVYTIQANYKTKAEELKKQIDALKSQERAEMVKVLTTEQRNLLIKRQVGDLPPATEPKSEGKKPVEKK